MFRKLRESAVVRNVLMFLAVLGPGIITGSVDNDAGGITTYSVAGATYGYHILWTLVPALVVLIVIQEMNARMGIVTGKGLADLIRENAGVKVTFLIFVGLILADIGNTTTEFAGVAGSMQALGVSKYLAVPLSAIALRPLAGTAASAIFAAGLFVASIFSATILPLATAFYVCEAFGFEAGIDKSWKEAPQFYTLFTAIILVSVAIILLPRAPLIAITIWSQVINGVLLPVVLVSMLLIINKREVMGEHVNGRFGNIVGWTTAGVLLVMNLLFFVMSFVRR